MANPNHRSHGLARHTMAYVLAGGRGSRLKELTDKRAKPAVFFGGKSRIIDFALSNAINSGIRRIGVATQYKAHSLIRHLQRGWNFFRPERNESFDILPASQRVSETQWYLGTADAVTQNIDIIRSYEPAVHDDPGGRPRLQDGLRADARAARELGRRRHGRLHRGAAHRGERLWRDARRRRATASSSFLEKPADPPGMPDKPDKALASMGIYVFEREFLFEQLRRDADDPHSRHDFGGDIIPYLVKHGKAVAHRFTSSCVRSDQRAPRPTGATSARSMPTGRRTSTSPTSCRRSICTTSDWPIWTYAEITPPAKFVHDEDGRRGMATSSLVSGGCIISGSRIDKSLLFTGVHAHSYSELEHVVALPYVADPPRRPARARW